MIKLRKAHCQPNKKPKIKKKNKTLYFNYMKDFAAVRSLKGFLPHHFPKATKK